jgi:hypothetical protein
MYCLAVMPSMGNVSPVEGIRVIAIGVTAIGVTIIRVTTIGVTAIRVIAIRVKLEDFEDIVGGRTSARRKPYKNDTRKPSNRTRSKRIYKYKAIDSIRKQGTDKQLLNVEVID